MRRLAACLVLFLACAAAGQEPPKPADVKKLAAAVGEATVEGDAATVVDMTYDGVVKAMGGREKAIALAKDSMKLIAARGVTITKFTVGEPGEFLTEGANTFVVIPTQIEMNTRTGTIKSKSCLLGISGDGGKTWKFADGAGRLNPALWEKALPKLPEKLKLPERTPPEVVKD